MIMASEAPKNLPLLYNRVEPLSSVTHGKFRIRQVDAVPFVANVHAIPLTIEEFIMAQRFYPIIFSAGESPVPLALMGLNEGINVFFDEQGKPQGEGYIPAYVRRYPFILARLRPDAEELSLCFDTESGIVGDFKKGTPLFDGEKPSETTTGILKFCEDFELAAQRTNAFMKELQASDLLIDGEVSIQAADNPSPFVYRGFRMVAEDKIRDLRGDELRKMNQNGMLTLIQAHFFSLPLIREVFAKQVAQGKMPQQTAEPAEA
jgi:hypothetical protein